MKEYFKEQIERMGVPLTEEDIQRLGCKKNGYGGELVPGDMFVYYLLYTTSKLPQFKKIAVSALDQFSEDYEFVGMTNYTPIVKLKEK